MSKTHFMKFINHDYLGSHDLADGNGGYVEVTATFERISNEKLHNGNGELNDCTILHFAECKPIIVRTKKKLRSFEKLFGSPWIEDWVGKQVTLYVTKERCFGEMMDVVRWKSPVPKPKPALDDGRFQKALAAIAEGKTTADKVRNDFQLTKAQEDALSNLPS
jgi:hypothetical protein